MCFVQVRLQSKLFAKKVLCDVRDEKKRQLQLLAHEIRVNIREILNFFFI